MRHVERILLIVAVISLGWYATARGSAMLYQASQHREFEQLRLERERDREDPRDDISLPAPVPEAAETDEADAPSAPSDAPSRALLPGSRPDGDTRRDAETPRASAEPRRRTEADARPRAGRGLIGRIQIPRLGLSAIVREGVDDRTLRRAVGHVPDTARPGDAGNVAFAAHRDTFFRPLKKIRVGDRIRVSTPDRDFDFVVSETRVVAPDDVSVLAPTPESALTLITCYPFEMTGPAPDRFIVRATAVDATGTRR